MSALIPSYSLQFKHISNPTSHTECLINRRTLEPIEAKVDDYVLELLNNIGRDYLFKSQPDPKTRLQARLTFSQEKGMVLETTDQKTFACFIEECNQTSEAVTIAQAEELQILHLPQRSVSAEEKKTAIAYFQTEDLLYFDPICVDLRLHAISQPVTIDFNLSQSLSAGPSGGTNTGILRFPHLLFHMAQEHKKLRYKPGVNICILGPGLKTTWGKTFSPQIMEIHALFSKAQYDILDKEPQVINQLTTSFCQKGVSYYDPFAFYCYLHTAPMLKDPLPKKYRKFFKEIGQNLGYSRKTSLDCSEIKVAPKQFNIRSFDLLTDSCSKESYDIIVATMSLSIAVETQLRDKSAASLLKLISNYTNALKVGGTLYCDAYLREFIQKTTAHDDFFSLLEAGLGHKIAVKTVPLKDFAPATIGPTTTLASLTSEGITKNLTATAHVDSWDILAITKNSQSGKQEIV